MVITLGLLEFVMSLFGYNGMGISDAAYAVVHFYLRVLEVILWPFYNLF